MKQKDADELHRISSSQGINGDKYLEHSEGCVIDRTLEHAVYILGKCKEGKITGYRLISLSER